MDKIGTSGKTKKIMTENDFFLKKHFGQNFLIDGNILQAIVKHSDINNTTNVIEIGPGFGALTEYLGLSAGKVLAYEIDLKLENILKENFKDQKNINFLFQDFLKADVKKDCLTYFGSCENIIVVANLPYYITTPLIMKILEEYPFIKKITIMIQKEVADRIIAQKGKEYNNLSIAIQYRSKVKKLFNVSKNCFMPAPNVDSSVIQLELYKRENKASDEKFFFELIRKLFGNRRKTLLNNVVSNYAVSKENVETILNELNLSPQIRSEQLSVDEIIKFANIFLKIVNRQGF